LEHSDSLNINNHHRQKPKTNQPTPFSILFYSTEKHNIPNVSKALEEAMQVLEEHLRVHVFLSPHSNHHGGDLAVYGTLRAVEGLPCHDQMVLSSDHTAIRAWYQRMKELTPSREIIMEQQPR
jgi:glutathione S-transferase